MMKFGLNLINFGPGASPDSLASSAEWAERVGFDLVMISDHVAITPDVARAYPAPFYEPFTALAWLAGRTTRIELGTTVVILPYRHPLLLARMASNLDQLSNGRLILGVGVGWARAEFEALGVAFARRGRLSNEYLEVLKMHWAEPKQQPHPPIWVGGRSPAAIRRAAEFGQAWHPLNVGLEWLSAEGLPLLRRAAEELQTPTPAFAPRIKVVLTDALLDDAERGPGQGTLDQIRRDMDQLAALEPAYVVLDTYTGQPDDLANSDTAQRTLNALLEHVIDLPRGTLR
jgi:alkanesulfonate monooxygenase SsuD/methylene tetrahydromethanopterin reductase-like flavin-dependent oxidoreductase (luciferase family)